MKLFVLDSYAMIAFLENEKGADQVSATFGESIANNVRVAITVVNWGEVFYISLRESGEAAAIRALDAMRKLPLEIVNIDQELTLLAGRFKANHKMSYADAFAAALAKLRNATLITGDKEFKPLEKVLKILWI